MVAFFFLLSKLIQVIIFLLYLMLSTPNVHFSLMPLNTCLFRGKRFYFDSNEFFDYRKATLQTYPALKHKKFTSLRVFKKYFKNMIKKLYQERSQVYKRIVQEYQTMRDQYNDQYFKTLSDFLHFHFVWISEILKWLKIGKKEFVVIS